MHKEHVIIPHYSRRVHVTYCYNAPLTPPATTILLIIDSLDGDKLFNAELIQSLADQNYLVCVYDVALQDDRDIIKTDIPREINTIITDIIIQPDCDHHQLYLIACDQPAGWLLCDVFDHSSVSKITLINPSVCDIDRPSWINTWKQPLLLIHQDPTWIASMSIKPNPDFTIAIAPLDTIKTILTYHKTNGNNHMN